MKKLYLFIIAISLSFSAIGQNRAIKKADGFYDLNYYSEAIKKYQEAEADDNIGDEKAYVTRRIAACYYGTFNYKQSLVWYEKLFKLRTKLSPEDYYNLGALYRINGQQEKAKEKFYQYANLVGDDELKEFYKNLVDWSEEKRADAQIKITKTNVDIGERALGVAYFDEGLIYSKPKTTRKGNKTQFYDLMYVETEKEEFGTTTKLNEFENNEFFNGSAYFSEADSVLYFTSNASDRKKFRSDAGRYHLSESGVNKLRIYSSKFADGKFEEKKDLSFNGDNFNCAHPTLNATGDTMYFVSDRPESLGGMDIYRSVKNGDKWGKVENLGSNVNTDKNEMFPYLVKNKLYFSSYGHLNYGGADIFESILHKDGTISKPENLGKPYNSLSDDFGLIYNPQTKDGYLSSNREDSAGYDHILYFKRAPADEITATAKKKFSLDPIDSVTVNLYKITGDDESLISSAITDTTGTVKLVLEKGKEYKAYFIKEGFTPDSIVKEIPKTDRRDIIALFDAPLIGAPMQIKNIYFAYDKWDIKEESKPVLDQLYHYMKEHNNINVFIGAHTDCRGTDLYNYKLSDKRAQSATEYLIQKGVHPDRLAWKGYGKSQIKVVCGKCADCKEEQHQQNRRVTFEIKLNDETKTDAEEVKK